MSLTEQTLASERPTPPPTSLRASADKSVGKPTFQALCALRRSMAYDKGLSQAAAAAQAALLAENPEPMFIRKISLIELSDFAWASMCTVTVSDL